MQKEPKYGRLIKPPFVRCKNVMKYFMSSHFVCNDTLDRPETGENKIYCKVEKQPRAHCPAQSVQSVGKFMSFLFVKEINFSFIDLNTLQSEFH